MDSISFFDTEIEPKSRKILDIGAVTADGNSFHSNRISDFIAFIKGSKYICGHNIFKPHLRQCAVMGWALFNDNFIYFKCFLILNFYKIHTTMQITYIYSRPDTI